MNAMLSVLLAIGTLVVLADDPAKKDKAMLQGKWTVISVESNGKAVEMWTDATRLVEGNAYTLTTKKGESFKGTFTVDPSKTPAAIDFKPDGGQYKGKTLRGIYEFHEDMLTICFAEPDKERPTEFSSKAGSGWTLAIQKKQKK